MIFGLSRYAYSAIETSKYRVNDIDEVLSRLENKMSDIHSLKTNFIQEKNLAILNKKLILKGTIFIEKPLLFAWYVKEPMKYSMVIKNDIIHQWDEETKKSQQISILNNSSLNAIITQMREWFSGTYRLLLDESWRSIFEGFPY